MIIESGETVTKRNCCGPTGGGGVLLGSNFAGYVALASQNIVYSVANYRPHVSHFWANVIVI